MKKVTIGVLAVLFVCLAVNVIAEDVAIPAAINYQGRLTDPTDGSPVKAGVYEIEFRVWDDPTDTAAGNLIWGRSFPVHVVTNGLFNILLTDDGAEVTSPTAQTNDIRQAFQGEYRYLGLTITHGPDGVVNSPEISPRQRMVSAPFAMHSQNATDSYHAEQADEATQAQNSDKLGDKSAVKYYNEDQFDALGLSGSYKSILGWLSGGGVQKTDLYDYFGSFCMSSSGPSQPDSGVKLLVQGGKIQADDGIIANGVITPNPGEGAEAGIRFPANIGGGYGDIAGISYHAVTNEDCELRIYSENDAGDKIKIEASGNVEINAGESLKLKNSDRVEVLNTSYHEYSMDKWYRATGDGMVSFWGYQGHLHYYQQTESGDWLTKNGSDDHWMFFFNTGGSDTEAFTMPVAKGDKIRFDHADNWPKYWKIRWRGFGNGVLVEE